MLEESEDKTFLQSVANQIEGWLVDYAARVTQQLLRKQEHGRGNEPLLEIGIYAGKYLSLLMASAGRTNSKVIGIDTFQYRPIEMVKENLAKLMPELAPILTIFPESSCAFPPDRLIKVLGGKARFISIDGSHEHMDVLHDLMISNEVLEERGIIAVDDFLNPLTIGVNRAVNAFMERSPGLEGFAYVCNKLFLARPEAAAVYRDFVYNLLTHDETSEQGRAFNERREKWRGLVEQPFFGAPLILVP